MADFASMLRSQGITTPSTQPSPQAAAPVPVPREDRVAQAVRALAHNDGAAQILIDNIRRISIRAKVHGAIMTIDVENIDPAGVIDGLKAIDEKCEFDTSFSRGGGYGGKKGDRKALVHSMMLDSYGVKILAQTAEGEGITAVWSSRDKDKLGEALKGLPLTPAELVNAAAALDGKQTAATIFLSDRHVSVEFYLDEYQGKQSFKATGFTTNGNGSQAPAGAA